MTEATAMTEAPEPEPSMTTSPPSMRRSSMMSSDDDLLFNPYRR